MLPNFQIHCCAHTGPVQRGGDHLSAPADPDPERDGPSEEVADAQHRIHNQRVQGLWGGRRGAVRAELVVLDGGKDVVSVFAKERGIKEDFVAQEHVVEGGQDVLAGLWMCGLVKGHFGHVCANTSA